MKYTISSIVSWLIALWISKVFVSSFPYKFANHPDTQHIFGTIGDWLSGFLGFSVGHMFTSYGPYVIGLLELVTTIVLILPGIIWCIAKSRAIPQTNNRSKYHAIGGLLASSLMAGAVFFHLASPLGVEVLHEGKNDGGSLFYAAVSILILGIVLFLLNINSARKSLTVGTVR